MSNATSAKRLPGSGRGCVLAIGLFAAGVVLVGGVGLGLAWHSGLLGKLHRGVKLAYDGSNAPGAKELRAMGCDQAMILNADDLAPLVGKTAAPRAEKIIVTCIGRSTAVPSCDDAALAYAHAIGPPQGGFIVTVRKTDGKGEHCMGRYAEDGALARALTP
jgi:hypothetical protein